MSNFELVSGAAAEGLGTGDAEWVSLLASLGLLHSAIVAMAPKLSCLLGFKLNQKIDSVGIYRTIYTLQKKKLHVKMSAYTLTKLV